MKKLIPILFVLALVLGVKAADVQFDLKKFTSVNAANRQVQITPIDLLPPAGVYPAYDAITFKSDTNGMLTVSNMYGGLYRSCLLPPPGPPSPTPDGNCVTLNITTNAGLVYAADCIVVATNAVSPSSQYAYSQAASDARYLTQSSLTNAVTNNQPVVAFGAVSSLSVTGRLNLAIAGGIQVDTGGNSHPGGNVTIQGGDSFDNGGAGGNVFIKTGNGIDQGGSVFIQPEGGGNITLDATSVNDASQEGTIALSGNVQLYDAVPSLSIDANNRLLINGDGSTALDYNARAFYDQDDNPIMTWGDGLINAQSGGTILDSTSSLNPAKLSGITTNSGSTTINFNNQQLSETLLQVTGTTTFAGFSGMGATTFGQQIMLVTNSSGSTVTLIPPAGTITNGVWLVTNAGVTKVVWDYTGKRLTNGFSQPYK